MGDNNEDDDCVEVYKCNDDEDNFHGNAVFRPSPTMMITMTMTTAMMLKMTMVGMLRT